GSFCMFGGAGIEGFHLHDVRDMNRTFAFDDSALGILLAFAHVFFDHARAFHDDALLFGGDADNAATLALLGPGDDDYLVAFSYMKSLHIQVMVINKRIR